MWQQSVGSIFNDQLSSNIDRQKYFFLILEKEMINLNKMLNIGQRSFLPQETLTTSSTNPNSATFYLKLAKDKISEISIIPTKDEVLCVRDQILPTTNMDDSLHYLLKGAERLLDTQFRLLREDMLCPIYLGIVNFIKFYTESAKNDAKIRRLQERGGRHKYDGLNGTDGSDLQIKVDKRRGFSCRMEFTQKINKVDCKDKNVALVDISFINTSIYIIAMKEIMKKKSNNRTTGCFMVESTGVALIEYFESYLHILKTIPANFPSEKYLAPQVIENSSSDPPTYTRAPGFKFDLSVLLEDKINNFP
ncbi:2001_t:CDS:2 [Scutellospora calospora]|uniref:2001_t:CDS:1 n=1 Tax=Scutellospora calospora TaxID=85575 RepID=A0ACA9L755_9GLOM|nr:2001_t:CDS:2 [Scutellospora calospora]